MRVDGTVIDAGGEARFASHGTAKAGATFYLLGGIGTSLNKGAV